MSRTLRPLAALAMPARRGRRVVGRASSVEVGDRIEIGGQFGIVRTIDRCCGNTGYALSCSCWPVKATSA